MAAVTAPRMVMFHHSFFVTYLPACLTAKLLKRIAAQTIRAVPTKSSIIINPLVSGFCDCSSDKSDVYQFNEVAIATSP